MSKTLSNSWLKCLPMLYRRCFGSEINGSWKESPRCGPLETRKKSQKCHPKTPSCAGNAGVCPGIPDAECSETHIKPKQQLSCCCNYDLTEKPCSEAPRKKGVRVEPQPFKSMWEVCGIEKECPVTISRLDEKHYVSSNKLKRTYTQTWENCGPMIRKRKICAFEDCMPPFEKRPKKECPFTAKEKDSEQLKVDYNFIKQCLDNVVNNPNTQHINKCRKIVMPCCQKVAKTTKCHRNRSHSKCLKDCCPYPSFSECNYTLKQPPARECGCSEAANICETNRFYVRKKMFMIPPPLPGWPPKERPK